MTLPEGAPKPRLCHLRKIPNFDGYGFNLHAEKGKAGQFIGKVDEGSPAALAGLKEGDRIIEVNGTNIGNENHQQVVQRIKAVADETKFLVVDAETDDWYRERKIVIRGDLLDDVEVEVKVVKEIKVQENGDEELKHKPRLCHMRIWPNFPGYGFNLHAEKGKSAQFIGKVDEKSPAEAAGLREGDRIIEVNGAVVLSETHQEVVKRIKSDPMQVTMLLVDPEAEEYFKEKGIELSSSIPGVIRIVCPETNPHGASNISSVNGDNESSEHKLRLCHIRAAPDGRGFGFNMQGEKGRTGQFIGSVDEDSPAEKAGLRNGDRIVEVNGVSIDGNSHKEVVEKIKAKPNETTLLVVDGEADKYFIAKGVVLSSSLACVVKGKGRLENGSSSHADSMDDSTLDDDENVADEIAEVVKKVEKDDEKNKKTEMGEVKTKAEESKSTLVLKVDVKASPDVSKDKSKTIESPKSPVVISGIEFAASAEEARRKMSKKKSVKNTSMSMKDKYALFQKM